MNQSRIEHCLESLSILIKCTVKSIEVYFKHYIQWALNGDFTITLTTLANDLPDQPDQRLLNGTYR